MLAASALRRLWAGVGRGAGAPVEPGLCHWEILTEHLPHLWPFAGKCPYV